jgi:hypothetical protein
MPPGGIRTHDLSRRAAVDLRLRPRGHWDRHSKTLPTLNKVIIKCTVHYIVHLECTFCLFLVRMKVRDSGVLVWVRGQRKMRQVLGAFGLLDFTMLLTVPAWRAFWNLWNVYFFNFPIFFSGRGKPRIIETADTESVKTGARLYNKLQK